MAVYFIPFARRVEVLHHLTTLDNPHWKFPAPGRQLFATCDSCERGVRSPKGAKPPAYIFDHFLETRIKQAAFDDPEIARLYDLFGGARMEFFPAYDATATNTSKTSGGNA